MTPEQWRQVEALFHAARAKAPQDRGVFLDEACGGDGALRAEVESLLAHAISGEEPQRESPWPRAVAETRASIQPGAILSHYRVEAPVGAGGMGEVFRAVDTRLNRSVAIKVAHAVFSERFRREAQALSALNNPHICTLFDVGPDYLVMELLEGETLAARLERGPLPLIETFRYGAQIADGLADAHAKGIIHRDLKPANIMITRTGVKLLDFGLAAVEGHALTQTGVVMGTPAYMAPEQSRGKDGGPQTDIYALGLVLHEMATGRLPVVKSGEHVTLSGLPESLAHVVERCLEETPSSRWQSAAEIRALLQWATTAPRPPALGRKPRRITWVLAVAAVVGVVGINAAVLWQPPSDPPPTMVRFDIPLTGYGGSAFGAPAVGVSIDGRQVARSGGGQPITVRSLDAAEPKAVSTDVNRENPFFSPDGEWLAFVGFGKGLLKAPIKGGPEIPIVDGVSFNPNFGGSWGRDDTIVFATGAGLFRVSADGGKPELMIAPQASKGELFYAWPEILPDGKSVLFAIVPQESASGSQVAILDLLTLKTRVLFRGGNRPRYLNSGHLVYVVGQTLEARAFDLASLELRGEPVSLNIDVEITLPYGGLVYDLSPAGTLAYFPASPVSVRTLVWVNRNGQEEPFASPGTPVAYPRISPDGLSVAIDVAYPAKRDIWVIDASHPSMKRQVSISPRPDAVPEWSHDGKYLTFSTENNGVFNVYRLAMEGGSPERIFESDRHQMPSHYASEKHILITFDSPNGGTNVGLLTLGTPSTFTPLLQERYQEQGAKLSPDGRWMAYESNESGRFEVYVRPFPDVQRKRWTISSSGGHQPRWSPDGNELFYVDAKNADMYSVPVRLNPEFEHAPPRLLFANKNYSIGGATSYDISKDGRFLMVKNPSNSIQSDTRYMTIIANWTQEIKKRFPR